MNNARPAPFRVMDCSITILSIGKSANNLRELRDHLAVVPLQSISHHFYESLLRPTFDDPEYRNDFALWARRQLHDAPLAERLGAIDPLEYQDLEQLRQHLQDVIEDRLSEISEVPHSEAGKEFQFLRSQSVVIDTGLRASTPEELATMIRSLSAGSVFFHFVEARRRPPLKRDDFWAWLEAWGPAYAPARDRLAAIDFSLWSLTELRERSATCLDHLTQEVRKK